MTLSDRLRAATGIVAAGFRRAGTPAAEIAPKALAGLRGALARRARVQSRKIDGALETVTDAAGVFLLAIGEEIPGDPWAAEEIAAVVQQTLADLGYPGGD